VNRVIGNRIKEAKHGFISQKSLHTTLKYPTVSSSSPEKLPSSKLIPKLQDVINEGKDSDFEEHTFDWSRVEFYLPV